MEAISLVLPGCWLLISVWKWTSWFRVLGPIVHFILCVHCGRNSKILSKNNNTLDELLAWKILDPYEKKCWLFLRILFTKIIILEIRLFLPYKLSKILFKCMPIYIFYTKFGISNHSDVWVQILSVSDSYLLFLCSLLCPLCGVTFTWAYFIKARS